MVQSSRQPISSQSRPVRPNSDSGQSRWSGPGVFVRVEFGVAFTPAKTKRLAFGYASKSMDSSERQHPAILVPGNGRRFSLGATLSPFEEDDDHIVRRRRIRTRSALQLRTSPVSPVSVLSPEEYNQAEYHGFYPPNQEPVFHPSPVTRNHRPAQNSQSTYRPSPISEKSYPGLNAFTYPSSSHANSYPPPQTPQASSSRIPPFPGVRQSTIDRKPLPSRFRLGEEGLPWNSPTFIPPADYLFAEPSSISLGSPEIMYAEMRRLGSPAESTRRLASPPESMRTLGSPASTESRRLEDPQRDSELGQLHQAMLGIDSMSLNNDWWEPAGSWDQLGEIGSLPRGPRGLGWAIAVPTRDEGNEGTGPSSQRNDDDLGSPPPYTQGQWGWDWEWEESFGYWVRGMRRSNSVR